MPTIKPGPHGGAVGEPADERLQLRRHAAGHGRLDDDILETAVLTQQQLQAHAPCSVQSAERLSCPSSLRHDRQPTKCLNMLLVSHNVWIWVGTSRQKILLQWLCIRHSCKTRHQQSQGMMTALSVAGSA